MKQATPGRVKTVARCIFPGGKAVLAGYDEAEEFLIGLTVKTKNVARWARAGVTSADRKKVERAVLDLSRID